MARNNRRDRLADVQATMVRIGDRRGLASDLYARMLHTRWRNVLAVFAGAYLVGNLVFATLYLIAGDAIVGAEPGSFVDAFSFSIQTMATIGYGGMTPHGVTGDILVATESFLGLLGLATMTGVAFAKLSRPRAGVLFSDRAVVQVRNGVPTFMFRVANTRGSDLAAASIKVTVLLDEISAEGERMRRLHDLALLRDSTPILLMSWQVMHPIDETSPLHGMSQDDLARQDIQVFANLVAIDGAYGQTVYASQVYTREHVDLGARFADVISITADGRRQLDLTKFHDTEAIPTSSAAAE